MKQIKHKSLLHMSLITILLIILTKSTTSWKEESTNNFDMDKIPDFLTLIDEHQKMCNNNNNGDDNKECQYLLSENIKDYSIKRKSIEANSLPLSFLMNNVQELTNKNNPDNHCSCGMDYRLADLGYGYFPRYIPTGVCRKDGCRSKYLKCLPRTYKVRVLRRKEADEPEVEQRETYLMLPDVLKSLWTMETVKVNVACQCSR